MYVSNENINNDKYTYRCIILIIMHTRPSDGPHQAPARAAAALAWTAVRAGAL